MSPDLRCAQLWNTSPYITTLQPGDSLYIPHQWMHEVISWGKTVAFSRWLID
jgi:ribosomal protein L16 Arg81 hydroxylase